MAPSHNITLTFSEQREKSPNPSALTARPAHHSPNPGLQHSFSPSQKTVVVGQMQPHPPAPATERPYLQQVPSNQPAMQSPPQSPRTQPQTSMQPPLPPELPRKVSTEEVPMQIIIRSPTSPTPPQQATPPGSTPAERPRNNSSGYWQGKYQEAIKELQGMSAELNVLTSKFEKLEKEH